MAWLLRKNYHIHGPNFEITSNPDEMILISEQGIGSNLPWHPSKNTVVARQIESYSGHLDDMTIVQNSIVVSRRFRDLVDQFEPGIHAFASIILERKNGRRFEDEYFLFAAQQDIDCIITDNDPKWFRHYWTNERGVKQIICTQIDPGNIITLSGPAIDGKHIWTAGLLGFSEVFVSDKFVDALKENMRGHLCLENRCMVVDRPWTAEEQMGPLFPRHLAYVASGRTVIDYTLGEVWG